MEATNSVTVNGYTILYTATGSGFVSIRVFSNTTSQTIGAESGTDGQGVIFTVNSQITRAVNRGDISSTDAAAITNYLNSNGKADLTQLSVQAKGVAQPTPTPVTPATPAPTTPASNSSKLAGAANDDSGIKQPNTAGSAPIPNNTNAGQANNASNPTNQNTPSPTNDTASNAGAPAPAGTEPADSSETVAAGAKIKGYNYSYHSTAKTIHWHHYLAMIISLVCMHVLRMQQMILFSLVQKILECSTRITQKVAALC